MLPFLSFMLKGKKIILGVTGSIAAYKAAVLVRLLVKQGAEVQVIMTEEAMQFIPALTLSTLSAKPVLHRLSGNGEWSNHVALGRSTDIMLIAPATAHTLAKMSLGLCDNLLLAAYLSATCPIFIAPAMDVDMWNHPATKQNVNLLIQHGVHLINVENGELASGLHGAGRMAEPEHIVQSLTDFFAMGKPLKGKRALVTAGPTYEPIDPVRFIGNYSSGKMGIAIAEELDALGAAVDLVLGPVSLKPGTSSIRLHPVTTAREMQQACLKLFPTAHLAVLAAAVADYRPAVTATEKIKKTASELNIPLQRNPDILRELGKQKKQGQLLAGFALETEEEEKNALQKLKDKNLDFIALNSLKDQGAGFQTDTNKVTLYSRSGEKTEIPLLPKRRVARAILQSFISFYEKHD